MGNYSGQWPWIISPLPKTPLIGRQYHPSLSDVRGTIIGWYNISGEIPMWHFNYDTTKTAPIIHYNAHWETFCDEKGGIGVRYGKFDLVG